MVNDRMAREMDGRERVPQGKRPGDAPDGTPQDRDLTKRGPSSTFKCAYPLPDAKKLGTAPAIFRFEFFFVPVEGPVPSRHVPYGHVFRAKFFEWLSAIDPQLVEVFHAPQASTHDVAIRPYAIGRLVEWERRHAAASHEKPSGDEQPRNGPHGHERRYNGHRPRFVRKVIFALNVFDEALGRAFAQYLFREATWTVEFGPHAYLLEKVAFHQLAPAHFTEAARPVTKIRAKFLTPTTFRSLEHSFDYRFPDPVALFTNVAHIWNTVFPEAAAIDEHALRAWVKAHVMATSYTLRTVAAEIGKKRPLVGCVGECTYLVRDINFDNPAEEDLGWSAWLDALGRLAEITNVGHNRTAALGVCRFKYEEFIKILPLK